KKSSYHRFGTFAIGGPRTSWAGKILPRSRPRELRASLAGDRGDEMLEVRDDRVLPAVLQEFDDGLDLRAHAPRRELAVREVLLRLGDGTTRRQPPRWSYTIFHPFAFLTRISSSRR